MNNPNESKNTYLKYIESLYNLEVTEDEGEGFKTLKVTMRMTTMQSFFARKANSRVLFTKMSLNISGE